MGYSKECFYIQYVQIKLVYASHVGVCFLGAARTETELILFYLQKALILGLLLGVLYFLSTTFLHSEVRFLFPYSQYNMLELTENTQARRQAEAHTHTHLHIYFVSNSILLMENSLLKSGLMMLAACCTYLNIWETLTCCTCTAHALTNAQRESV